MSGDYADCMHSKNVLSQQCSLSECISSSWPKLNYFGIPRTYTNRFDEYQYNGIHANDMTTATTETCRTNHINGTTTNLPDGQLVNGHAERQRILGGYIPKQYQVGRINAVAHVHGGQPFGCTDAHVVHAFYSETIGDDDIACVDESDLRSVKLCSEQKRKIRYYFGKIISELKVYNYQKTY